MSSLPVLKRAFVLISLLAASAYPQGGTRADYERAARLRQRFADVPIGPRSMPSWIAGTDVLWLVEDGAGGVRRVIVVDCSEEPRRIEFQLNVTDLGGEPERLAPAGARSWVLLTRSGRVWQLGAKAAPLRVRQLDPPDPAAEVFLIPPKRTATEPPVSGSGGPARSLVFRNDTDGPVTLRWIDGSGQPRPMGAVEARQTRQISTYATHVFDVLGASDDESHLWVRAGSESGLVSITRGRLFSLPESLQLDPTAAESPDEPRSQLGKRRLRLSNGQMVFSGGEYSRIELAPELDWSARLRKFGGWSPDRRAAAALAVERLPTREVTLVESTPADQLQPRTQTFEYAKPGDPLPRYAPMLVRFDPSGAATQVSIEPASLFENAWSLTRPHWRADGKRFSFVYNQRGHRVVRLITVDVATGRARAIVEEAPETFVDYAGKLFAAFIPRSAGAASPEVEDVLWMTERSGWNQLVLVDGETGATLREVTAGEFVVRRVVSVDAEQRTALLQIMGYHKGEDPYHVHLARVSLDTGELTLLTAGDGTHSVDFSPSGRWLIDSWERVDQPLAAVLRSAKPAPAERGKKPLVERAQTIELVRGSTSELEAAGWRAPERFVAKGRDGTTDIWGIAVRPTNFDPSRRYPVIEQIYAGPHGAHVPKTFAVHRELNELAELGFIVVQIDGMGTNWRSKAFHDVAWKNLGDAGFPDRVLWLEAFAKHEPAADLSRVGIYGGSAGGQNAMRALIAHPETYRVAVADCGCHDNRMDKIWWNELWMSWPLGPHYDEASNVKQAHRMQGQLLLIVGELDRNVDPASTLQVVDALIRADKDFDLLLIPGAGHGAGGSPYGQRRTRDFFVRHLLGVEPRR